jgi:GTPase SAR1 family protein
MNKLYYRGSHGVVFVCDINEKESLQELEGWLKDYSDFVQGDLADVAFILLANKSDL